MLASNAKALQIAAAELGPHTLRTTATADMLNHDNDIAKVQEWRDYAIIATTKVYDWHENRLRRYPTFEVDYRSAINHKGRFT